MFNTNYPTTKFTWRDNSGASTDVLFSAPDDGLNVPFFFVLAERGVPGQIYFGGAKELNAALGSETFNPSSPYFNASTAFCGAAMAGQGVEVMRLVDEDATAATFGLFLEVTQAPITQYQKDPSGARLIDQNGNYIPRLQAGGTTPVTEAGVILKWTFRQLTTNENYLALTPVSVQNGSVTTTIYPILAGKMDWVGSAGNRQGFMLYSTGTLAGGIANTIDSVLYRFVPMQLPTAVSTTASVIPDVFGQQYNDISFKPKAIYEGTNTNYSFDYVLGNSYTDSDGNNLLPYSMQVYSQHILTIGNLILSLSPELSDLTPYKLDLISGADLSGNLYDHVQINPLSLDVVNPSVTKYALGGSDGDTSWQKFESLVYSWLTGSDHGEFTNLQQHPMTHYSDPGFSVATKTALLNMLDLRDNFKIDLSTQDITLPPNTKAQDLSTGQLLLFRAQMHPESVINGVGCTRVGIYAHAASLINGSPYSTIVPFTYNRLLQRRQFDGGTYIRGSAGGLPYSQVTDFKKPNWVADDPVSQARSWASAINTVRHASRTVIHYPSIRTVYPNDTSLLSDDEVSDRIIYAFKIVRRIWARYAGVRKVPTKLFPLIQNDINNECAAAFSGDDITVQATVFQTAADKNLGAQVSVNLAFVGNLPIRTFNVNVIVERAPAQN